MKRRILAGLTVAVILAFAGFGLFKRQSYTDIQAEENWLEQMQVAELPERQALLDAERLAQTLPEAPFILRVRVLEDVEFLFGDSRQKVRVEQIYADAGGGLSAGDEIYLTGQCSLSFVGQRSLQCNFVNLPKIGSEYLIFAGEHLDVPNEPDLYRLAHVHEFFIAPIFCCEDSPHTIAPTSGPSTNVPYSAVKNNEFFAETEAGFQAWYGLKRQLLAAYP